MIRVLSATFFLAWGVLLAPLIVRGQIQDCPEERPSEEALTRIRDAGRWLALYDIVCSRAENALDSHGYSADESPCLARRSSAGWQVAYGSWKRGDFRHRLTVQLNSKREVSTVEPRDSSLHRGWAYEMSRAASRGWREAKEELGELTKQYRYEVFVANYPWDGDTLTTYVYPVPEEGTALGGDFRVKVDAHTGAVLEGTRLHNEVVSMDSTPQNSQSSASTAVRTCLPTETDVFMVLRRESSRPHLVVAEQWVYGIEPNGEVKVLRRREK